MADYYYDSSASAGGNGSQATPYNVLTGKATLAASDRMLLKRGSLFRTAFPTLANNVSILDYGTAQALPEVRGSDIVGATAGAWTAQAGNIWSMTLATAPNFLHIQVPPEAEGYIAIKGATATVLNNREWFHTGGALYVRCNAGNPATVGWIIEAPQRTYSLNIGNITGLSVSNVILRWHNTIGINHGGTTTGTVVFSGLQLIDNWHGLSLRGDHTFSDCGIAGTLDPASVAITVAHSTAKLTATKLIIKNTMGIGISCLTAGISLSLNSSTIVGTRSSAIRSTLSTPFSIDIRNTVIAGCLWGSSGSTVHNTGTCSVTVSDSIIQPPAGSLAGPFYRTDTVTLGANVSYRSPRFKSLHPVFVNITADDLQYAWSNEVTDMIADLGSSTGCDLRGVTAAVFETTTYNQTDIAGMQYLIDHGGEIASHTHNHTDPSTVYPIRIRYTGGSGACALTVSGTVITTSCTNPAHNLTITLTGKSMAQLATELDASAYYVADTINFATLTALSGMATDISATMLADVAGQAISIDTTYSLLSIDKTLGGKYDSVEISGHSSRLASLLTETDGTTPYSVESFVYPGGHWKDQVGGTPVVPTAEIWIKQSGLKSARTVGGYAATGVGNTTLARLDLFKMPATFGIGTDVNSTGVVAEWPFENAATSNTGNNTLAATNVTYAATPTLASGYYCAAFSGNGYLSAGALTNMAFTSPDGRADWMAGAVIQPTTLNAVNTIMFYATDDNNYVHLYVTSTGAVQFVAVVAGATVIDLASTSGVVAANVRSTVSVAQSDGRIVLRHGSGVYARTVIADLATTAVPVAASQFRLGASYLGGAHGNYFTGYMDQAFMATSVLFLASTQLDWAAINNGFITYYGHGQPNVELMREIFRIYADYGSATIRVWTTRDIVRHLTANGSLSDDGYYLTYRDGVAPDYAPAANSPANTVGYGGATYLGAIPPTLPGRKLKLRKRILS